MKSRDQILWVNAKWTRTIILRYRTQFYLSGVQIQLRTPQHCRSRHHRCCWWENKYQYSQIPNRNRHWTLGIRTRFHWSRTTSHLPLQVFSSKCSHNGFYSIALRRFRFRKTSVSSLRIARRSNRLSLLTNLLRRASFDWLISLTLTHNFSFIIQQKHHVQSFLWIFSLNLSPFPHL